jgi:hypothetical protein
MAKYDYGGGCPCGLYRECIPQCEHATVTTNITSIQKVRNMQDDHDFGFTFADEEQFTKVEKIVDEEKLKKLRAMIMPLLLNLKKGADKDIIQWPAKERIKSVDAFIQKMDKLIDG